MIYRYIFWFGRNKSLSLHQDASTVFNLVRPCEINLQPNQQMRRALPRCLLLQQQRFQSVPQCALGVSDRAGINIATWQQPRQQAHCCQHLPVCSQPTRQYTPAVNRDRTLDASCSSSQHACTPAVQPPLQGHIHQPWRHPYWGAALQRLPASSQQQQQQQRQQQRQLPLPQRRWEALLPPDLQRCYATRVPTNPSMPPELVQVITEHAAIKAERPPAPPLQPRPLTFESRRSGVIAIKAGMMQDWDEYGARVPLTVLWVDECMVLRHKHMQRDGVTSLVLACGSKRPKQLHPRQLGEFQAAELPPKRKLWEMKVSEDALLPAGILLGAAHFRAGQYLDITGTTKGKGFAGVMKRWNFAGQGASHGNTKHHRAPGSIGGRTDPGRVWKGKKMPGRLGGETKTFKNIWLYKVDPERNLLYVRGQVPGPQGSFVLVRDAFRWKWREREAAGLPFPTHIGELPPVAVAPRDGKDPYRIYREDVGYFEANWKGD